MSKYDAGYNYQTLDIENAITEGESVIWSGKPKKSAFIINKSVVMLPIALIWLAFDGFFISAVFSSGGLGGATFLLLGFLAFHLMPVWIWLSNVLTARKRWENTQYAVTDKRIIIKSGFIGMDYESIYYKDISNVRLNVGVIDKLLGVGDIHFETGIGSGNARVNANSQSFLDIENVYDLYPKLQKVVLDIQSDIHYPNDLRPEENKGYSTKYAGKI